MIPVILLENVDETEPNIHTHYPFIFLFQTAFEPDVKVSHNEGSLNYD